MTASRLSQPLGIHIHTLTCRQSVQPQAANTEPCVGPALVLSSRAKLLLHFPSSTLPFSAFSRISWPFQKFLASPHFWPLQPSFLDPPNPSMNLKTRVHHMHEFAWSDFFLDFALWPQGWGQAELLQPLDSFTYVMSPRLGTPHSVTLSTCPPLCSS